MKPALGSALTWEEESGARFGEVNPGGQQGAVLRKPVVPPNRDETCGFLPGKHQLGPLSLGNSRLPLLLWLQSCIPIENVLPATSCPHFRTSLDPWEQLGWKRTSPQEQITSMSWSHEMAGGFGELSGLSAHPRGKPGWLLCCPPRRQGLAETPFAPAFRLCASPGPHSGRGMFARGVQNPVGPLDRCCWTPHIPGGACAAQGAPASEAARGGAGMAPASPPPPSLAFRGQRAPKMCSNSILP